MSDADPRDSGYVRGVVVDGTGNVWIEVAIEIAEAGKEFAAQGAILRRLADANTKRPSKKTSRSGKLVSARGARPIQRGDAMSASLLGHAVETFGTEQTARKWLSSECGALGNRTPLQMIQGEDNEAEVDRILDCIDYGMLA